LNHAACAVADQRIGADGAAMVEIDQDAQALMDDVVGPVALDIGHEADAARVVLVAWVVKSLFLRQIHQKRLLPNEKRSIPPDAWFLALLARQPAGAKAIVGPKKAL
jgi:hypothetical protein